MCWRGPRTLWRVRLASCVSSMFRLPAKMLFQLLEFVVPEGLSKNDQNKGQKAQKQVSKTHHRKYKAALLVSNFIFPILIQFYNFSSFSKWIFFFVKKGFTGQDLICSLLNVLLSVHSGFLEHVRSRSFKLASVWLSWVNPATTHSIKALGTSLSLQKGEG